LLRKEWEYIETDYTVTRRSTRPTPD
jgi:hypothetical protein